MSKDWYKENKIVSEDVERQFERIQEILDKNNLKVINLTIRKDTQKKEPTLNLRVRLRTVQPDRNLLKEVFGIAGKKSIELG